MKTQISHLIHNHYSYKIVYDVCENSSSKVYIICIHSLLRNRFDFTRLQLILFKYFNIVKVDLIGHGQSEHLQRGNYSLKIFAQSVISVINALSAKNVVIIGDEFGAKVAEYIAAIKNFVISGVVLHNYENNFDDFIQKVYSTYSEYSKLSFSSLENVIEFIKTDKKLYNLQSENLTESELSTFAIQQVKSNYDTWIWRYDLSVLSNAESFSKKYKVKCEVLSKSIDIKFCIFDKDYSAFVEWVRKVCRQKSYDEDRI